MEEKNHSARNAALKAWATGTALRSVGSIKRDENDQPIFKVPSIDPNDPSDILRDEHGNAILEEVTGRDAVFDRMQKLNESGMINDGIIGILSGENIVDSLKDADVPNFAIQEILNLCDDNVVNERLSKSVSSAAGMAL